MRRSALFLFSKIEYIQYMLKKKTLSNGLRIILAPQKGSLTATALVLVEAGSEYETKEINGLSHFLEHMCFKGTSKRPKAGMISEELDALGAEYNAFTDQQYTGYWAKVEKNKLYDALELISDLYINPIFDQEEINKERGVVIEELNMYEDTPMRKVGDYFNSVVFGDQPAGWDVGGTKEVIANLNREHFIEYRLKHYVPSKTIVVISGNFSEAKVLKDIKKYFGPLEKRPVAKKLPTKVGQTSPQIFSKHKESEQDHFILGFPGINVFDKRRYALSVLSNILGGGMSSRLFKKVRDEMGAAYYVRSGADFAIDHGMFAVSAGTAHAKTKAVIEAILKEIVKLKTVIVPKEELKRAKDSMISSLVLGLETSDQLANFYGGQEVLAGKTTSPTEVMKKIKAVTAKDIQQVAKDLFKANYLNLASIGRFKEEELRPLLTLD